MNELEKYFKILEIEIGASKEKIKKAYRKLAHQHHLLLRLCKKKLSYF